MATGENSPFRSLVLSIPGHQAKSTLERCNLKVSFPDSGRSKIPRITSAFGTKPTSSASVLSDEVLKFPLTMEIKMHYHLSRRIQFFN